MAKDYKELKIWQQAMDLVLMVYKATGNMPREENYGLTNQIRRAAVSIPSNIAEGESRGTKEFIQFLKIVQGSMAELETQLILTSRLNMIETNKVEDIIDFMTGVKKQTYNLINKLSKKL
ncbi:MAG: four helix bundle protein [Bacteroidales bacterium]|jgi:four helix bundle protein|nr:four helix bundle protein [Bacteroidales bacterium]